MMNLNFNHCGCQNSGQSSGGGFPMQGGLGRAGGGAGSPQMMQMVMQMLQMFQMMQMMGGGGGMQMPGSNPGFGGMDPMGALNGGGGPGMNNFLGSAGNNYSGKGGQPGPGNYDSGRQDNGAGSGPSTNGGERVGGPTGNLTQRAGGQIDSSIAGSFDAMVAAAARDGVRLEIRSAFRSRREQERLYAAYRNGTGNLAARPGTSNHERGQAIDFKGNRGAWDWLARNAERFGFRNLPGEPWHYSPTGR